jgi:hypothetical protein
MAEHKRENGWQWCDTTFYAVFDQHCGLERVRGQGFLVSLEDALEYVSHFQGWEDRKRILKIEGIAAYELLPKGDKL